MTINPSLNRAGAKVPSNDGVMHEARNHALNAAHRICASCGCDDCADVQGRLEGAPSFEPSANMALDKSQAGDIERRYADNALAVLDRMQKDGLLNSTQAQLAAAAIAIRPMVNNVKV
jgi:hypothetical protein